MSSYFCLNYFEYIFFYWIYYYFGEVLHVRPSLTAVATTCIMLGMVVLGPAGGWISDRIAVTQGLQRSRRKVVICVLTLSAAFLCAGASGFGVATTIALLTLAFGFASMSEGPFWASAISVAQENAGAAGGLMNTIGNIGGILAPVLTPLIASRFGWQAALWAGSGRPPRGYVRMVSRSRLRGQRSMTPAVCNIVRSRSSWKMKDLS